MSEKPPGRVHARRIFETSLYGPDLDELEASTGASWVSNGSLDSAIAA